MCRTIMTTADARRNLSQPFADECIARNNRFEAKKYIARLPPEQRVLYYMKIK